MIIDIHCHYTTEPQALHVFRDKQLAGPVTVRFTVAEDSGTNTHRLAQRTFNRKPACVDLRHDTFDDDSPSSIKRQFQFLCSLQEECHYRQPAEDPTRRIPKEGEYLKKT